MGKLRPTVLLLVAYAALSFTLFLAWTWWERLAGLAVTAVLALGLEQIAKWEAAGPQPTAERRLVPAPTWFRVAMWLGVLAGLAGTIGGAVSLIVEPDATLVGPLLSPIVLVIFVRFARLRVEIRGDTVLVANVGSTHRVRRAKVAVIQHDRGAGSANRRLRLLLRDERVVDIGLSGRPDVKNTLLSAGEADALAALLATALGVTVTELVGHDAASDYVDERQVRVRQVVGAVCGVAYGLAAPPGGALAIAGLAAFCWFLAATQRENIPRTMRAARQRATREPLQGLFAGRMFFIGWVAPAAAAFAVVAAAIAVGRMVVG